MQAHVPGLAFWRTNPSPVISLPIARQVHNGSFPGARRHLQLFHGRLISGFDLLPPGSESEHSWDEEPDDVGETRRFREEILNNILKE